MKVKLLKENKVGWSIDGVLHDIETEFEINDKTYESAISAGIKLEKLGNTEVKRKTVSSKTEDI